MNDQTEFDRLGSAQLARLVRLAGLHEVALACMRIEAVESVTGFLRHFAEDDARAIATQINGLSRVSNERSSFAEEIVEKAMEIEPKPSAMLHLLGLWLVGTFLQGKDELNVEYAVQRFPFAISGKLTDIIEEQGQKAADKLRKKICEEIENLAASIISANAENA